MSDAEMQFGELEQTQYQTRRRPDRDGHFAVVAYGSPAAEDLPIFIDMDVLADIERHAQEDATVELGGVLLGGQYHDLAGQPFVLIRDSIRAEAYESSRGHFKFTQETWSRIGRRRDEFNEDLHMVGWYHTHPGWGIFLSSMDRFICENFFNRQLDVAYVVDPVALERGWFYWKQGASETLPRAGGFYVTASRFRKKDLQRFVALLQGDGSVSGRAFDSDDTVMRREVVHLWRPQLGWLGIAIVAILALQCLLMLWIARPPARPPGQNADGGGDAMQVARLEARQQLFDQLVGKVWIDEQGQLDLGRLASEYEGLRRDAQQLERANFLLNELTDTQRRLKQQLESRDSSLTEAQAEKEKLLARLAVLQRQLDVPASGAAQPTHGAPTDSDPEPTPGGNLAKYTAYALFGILIVGGIAGPWLLRRFASKPTGATANSPRTDSPRTDSPRAGGAAADPSAPAANASTPWTTSADRGASPEREGAPSGSASAEGQALPGGRVAPGDAGPADRAAPPDREDSSRHPTDLPGN